MLLTETYPPEINGVAMTLAHLAEGLARRGHEVLVMRPKQAWGDHPIPEPANPAHRLVWGIPFPWYKGIHLGLPYPGQLRRNIHRFKPDVIHVATEGLLGVAGVLAAHAYGVPIVSSYHTDFFSYSRKYGLGFLRAPGRIYFKELHNATLRTFVPSQTSLAQLQAFKYKNLAIMSRGVDTKLFDPARRSEELRASWDVASTTPVMLYVGRIAAEKNLQLMLKAFERLRTEDPAAKMVLVGDGPDCERLHHEHPEYIFAGKRTGVELATYYASADLFVFPSVTETYGNVVVEAMASGLVVLAYNYAAPREHISDGVNGFLAPHRKEAEFLAKFEVVLAAKAAWEAIRASARAKALTLSWENVVASYEATVLGLEEICKARR
jgi:glycosyltransferase involved in cell wall biosynthesis